MVGWRRLALTEEGRMKRVKWTRDGWRRVGWVVNVEVDGWRVG